MIRIVEVGPRDGLQNESAVIPTDLKIAFVDALSRAGLYEIEVTAFVSPKWVPQLGDAEAVLGGAERRPGTLYSALVPNERGLDRAMSVGVDKIAVFTAASETFTSKNINTTIEGSIRRFRPVMKRAKAAGLSIRGYVSTAFCCPYEGRVEPAAVRAVVDRSAELDVNEFSLGDTVGRADVGQVHEVLDALGEFSVESLAMHFHDTFGRAAANVEAAHERGVSMFDSSVGGIGGCPYAPGASGNIATQTLIDVLRRRGETVDVDVQALSDARALLDDVMRDRPRYPKTHQSPT